MFSPLLLKRTFSIVKELKPWTLPMSAIDFDLMKQILSSPSPVGLEGGMTFGVIEPFYKSIKKDQWNILKFKGNAGIVLDTHPNQKDLLTVMIVGHADKIRMQVQRIGEDGKIWVKTDSMLPATLIGNKVTLFFEDLERQGSYRSISGGTAEALGAIHFAENDVISGAKGITKKQIYIELGMNEKESKEFLLRAGIKPGDPILYDRPISPSFAPNTFSGAYLDNGLGCFMTAKLAQLLVNSEFKNIRCLFACVPYEEIGRFGSRVIAHELNPDIILATDVNHDYEAAPDLGGRHFPPLQMGKGFTISHGATCHPYINSLIEKVAKTHDIPVQIDCVGGDTGTDAMAGVLSGLDIAVTSIGYPIRNMHTISEIGNTQDIIAATYAIKYTLEEMESMNNGKGLTRNDLISSHPRLDLALPMYAQDVPKKPEVEPPAKL